MLPGVQYFAFKHDETYQDAQLQFLNAVAMHDPNALMFLIQVHPYHVDGLLQVSEMAKQSGDWTVAGDCIGESILSAPFSLYLTHSSQNVLCMPVSGPSILISPSDPAPCACPINVPKTGMRR